MGCFPYEFPFGGAGKLNLKFPVSYVIGDIKGLSTLCGMYGNSNCNLIHWACNCSFEASDNPDVKCTRLEWHEICNLVDNRDKERLQALSQHMVDNAFYKVQFCDDVYGIHGCTPVGSLHALQLGLFQYYLEGLMSVFHYKKNKICAFDDLAKVISSHCAHQSDRTYPTTSFTHGITTTARTMASNMTGILFVLSIGFVSEMGRTIFNKAFADDVHKVQGYQQLVEWLLCFEAYVGETSYRVGSLQSDEAQIRTLMRYYKEIIARTDGNGLKLPKFHQVVHYARDIERLGPPRAYNEGRPESNLKDFAKRPAEVTQKRVATVSQQAGTRMVEHLVIEHAYNAERDW
jgi:hypothetical protein